ncbi:uncharacterized protein LOC135682495 isoform X2 [Rhopilema esculentum]|uniref:uncharacterized protein LOC135682495 isoform X2 n=1 Tax=Rhopilema esculentum TaxID=499914 RepID=UPI0031D8FADB
MPSIDVIKSIFDMTQGSTMLKAGRMGRPHFRRFRLLDDLSGLQWESPKKDKGDSSVTIKQIEELVRGQNTKVFQDNPIPEYEALLGGFGDLDAVREFRTSQEDSISDKADKLSLEFGFVGETVSVREDACDVYTWGSSYKGMLGHGEETEEVIPRVVEALLGRDVRQVACGTEHMLAVTSAGELFSWGCGRGGKLGHGDIQDRFTPLRVGALSEEKVVGISCHELHSAVVTAEGNLYVWGRAEPYLGFKTNARKQTLPRKIEDLSNVTQVACGLDFTIALTADSQLYSFGENERGQLGLGDTETRTFPALIECLSDEKIMHISCGTSHAGIVTASGDVWMWGSNDYGQLTSPELTDFPQPFKVPPTYWNEFICSISCGGRHTAVLSASGTVYCFGDGRNGQLGVRVNKQSGILSTPSAVRINGGQSKIAQIACGAVHTAALSDDGKLYIWGKGSSARLGHGDHRDRGIANEIESMIYKKVKQVSCGGRITAACVIRAWVQDQETKNCMACKLKFTTVRRRHHCRKCGGIFCANCSSKRIPILEIGYSDPVRVCERCYHTLSDINA